MVRITNHALIIPYYCFLSIRTVCRGEVSGGGQSNTVLARASILVPTAKEVAIYDLVGGVAAAGNRLMVAGGVGGIGSEETEESVETGLVLAIVGKHGGVWAVNCQIVWSRS